MLIILKCLYNIRIVFISEDLIESKYACSQRVEMRQTHWDLDCSLATHFLCNHGRVN